MNLKHFEALYDELSSQGAYQFSLEIMNTIGWREFIIARLIDGDNATRKVIPLDELGHYPHQYVKDVVKDMVFKLEEAS